MYICPSVWPSICIFVHFRHSVSDEDGGHGDDGDECCNCIASRWTLSIIGFLVFTMLYALRFNVSVAVVAMAGNVTEKGDDNGTIIVGTGCCAVRMDYSVPL